MASRAESASESKRGPLLVRVAMAPLVLIEWSRGWRRFALLVLYVLIVVASGAVIWWATCLNGLPDVGDPEVVAALRSLEVPDGRNAFVLYRRAAEVCRDLSEEEAKALNDFEKAGWPLDWRAVDPALKDWLAANREALDLWRAGSERPDALLIRPEELTIETVLGPVQALSSFRRLGLLEAARLEAEGDMAGAWDWYRALRPRQPAGGPARPPGPATDRHGNPQADGGGDRRLGRRRPDRRRLAPAGPGRRSGGRRHDLAGVRGARL